MVGRLRAVSKKGATVSTCTDEWKRTDPDLAVYLPEKECGFDATNIQFLVVKSLEGDWLAFWTRAAEEDQPNSSMVVSRSTDRGATWSEPVIIDGPAATQDPDIAAPDRTNGNFRVEDACDELNETYAGIAVWGFPILAPALGRIYCFYCKNEGIADFRYDICGVLRGKWSEDDGRTWSKETIDLPIRRTIADNPDPRIPINWIVWQLPYVTSRGEVIAPFSRWSSPKSPIPKGSSESHFLRFDNIRTEPDVNKLTTTTLPDGERGLRVPYVRDPSCSLGEEPTMVELSDGRFYCIMRTAVGYIAYSLSEDSGHTWSTPAPLYRDFDGELMLNPIVPCPIYKLKDGRYILLYYNNNGDANGGHFPCGYACHTTNRYPAYISVGREDLAEPYRPIRFGPPKVFLDTGGAAFGPSGRTETGCYPSLLEDGDERILFYPDRAHFLLGKRLTDEWLADCEPGEQ